MLIRTGTTRHSGFTNRSTGSPSLIVPRIGTGEAGAGSGMTGKVSASLHKATRGCAMLAARDFFELPVSNLTPELEAGFFATLRMRNGTYKTTWHARFATVNERLLPELSGCGVRAPKILDVGVSSGVSTMELYDDVMHAGLVPTIVATDYFTDAFLIKVFPGFYTLVDDTGFPLRFDTPFGSMKPWVTKRDQSTGFAVVRKTVNLVMGWRSRRALSKVHWKRVRKVKLVSPSVLENAHIDFRNDNLSKYNAGFSKRFDFIRVANLLNVTYFAPPALRSMIANLAHYVKGPGSILLVARTLEDGDHEGTLFRVSDDYRFEIAWRLGKGSEVEDMVLSTGVGP